MVGGNELQLFTRQPGKVLLKSSFWRKLWKEQWMCLGGKHSRQRNSKCKGPEMVVSLTFQGAERWSTLLTGREEISEVRVKVKRWEQWSSRSSDLTGSWQSHEKSEFYSERYGRVWTQEWNNHPIFLQYPSYWEISYKVIAVILEERRYYFGPEW